MKKRIISFFTALSMTLMLFTSMPTSVFAVDGQLSAVSVVTPQALPENGELEKLWIDRLFYGDGISLYKDYGRNHLNGAALELYEQLRAKIEAISAGTDDITSFPINMNKTFGSKTELDAGIKAAMDALMADLPADFYWYDKTAGYVYYSDSAKTKVTKILFAISEDYVNPSGGSEKVEYDDGKSETYKVNVDSSKMTAARTAVQNAQAIAAKYADKSDYEKIIGYKNEICRLVEYNDFAADDNNNTPYGDPWQLVWVFDNDTSTNVVCEGYSKAFQYLCDLGGVECYTVSGTIDGTSSGPHMWNIVALDGKSYHVDITNCDEGTVGEPDAFLLKGAEGSFDYGCSFGKVGSGSESIGYTYDDDTKSLYSAEILMVSTEDYTTSESDGGTCGAAGNEDNVTWTLDSDGVLTISGTGEMASYSDSSYFGMIISPWRTNHEKDVKSVVIESGITCINSHAFYDCSNITSVSIPNTVTYIGSSAFNSCESLTSIAIPSSVETINWHAFMGCTHLENITIEGTGLQTIGESVFQETIFSSINIPESVTEIEPGAFAATKLTTLKLPSNITSIADSMFFACENLESLIIPDKVESIGIGAFADCPNLEYVLYPAGASLGEYAFANFNEYDEYDNPIDGPATQLKYEPDGNKRRITEIILGSGKTGVTVTDGMNVSFVAENERSKVSQNGHTHVVADGVCQICNAAASNHTHKVCADSNHADCAHSDVEYEPFPSGNNSLNIITSDKNYYLTEDLTDDTLLYDIFIEGAAVNFCLNGHTIITEKKGFTVSNNGVLNICDCKTGGGITNTLYTEGVAGTGENGTLNIYGGKFCGEKGSGIFTGDNSITNIYGGEISSAEADCIWLKTGSTLSIYGGTIKSTTDKKDCISTFGNTTINISGGTVIGKRYGINLDDSNNTVNIKDGTIIGKDNAAVYAEAGDTINISGGKVLSEKSSGYSISNYGTMNISGGTFGGNAFNYITNYGSLSLRGNPTLINTGIWLCNDNNITISGALTNTKAYPIYVTGDLPRTFTNGYDTYMTDKNVSKYFKSPYSYIKVAYRNGEAVKVYYYKITYDANGGSCLLQSSEANGSDKLTSLATPTREGFNFDGWFTKAVGGEQITTDTVFTNDTTIYAHWTCDHDWGDTYENDDAQHWQICTKCSAESEKSDHTWDEGEVTKPSTETEEGEMTYKCTVCSATKTESIDKIHTHTFSPAWSSNDTYHWHASTCGHTEAVDGKEEHIFVDGKCKVCQRPDPNYETPTDTSASVTEPPETDPSDTGSSETQPPETDPSDTGSSETQPPETDPSDTEPSVTQPPETDPSDTEPSVTQPPETDPSDTEPSVTQPPETDPSETEPTVTKPPVTNPSYSTYSPSNSTSIISVPKEPFLQDENGKIGWAVISDDIINTADGETVTVNMNGTTELPKNIVSEIEGRDIDLVLIMNGGFVWTVNGMSVTKAKTLDMGVKKISKIPKSIVREFFGDLKTVQIDLRHNGDFGFTAELTVDFGEKYSGLYANSYCYKSRNFEFGDSAEIMDGQAKLRFNHASRWLITVEDCPVLEDVSAAAAAHGSGTPIDMSNSINGGITVPEFDEKRGLKLSNRKRRYRILKKRRLEDMVFVL